MRRMLLGFFIVSIVFVSYGCPDPDPSGYAIGDIGPSGVGIVFYITDGGEHGLEAAPHTWYSAEGDPQGSWSNVDTAVGLSAQGTGIGTGFDNTEAIIAQDGHTDSAADLCRNYTGGGLDDWFLPSRDELDEMNSQMQIIGDFLADQYWSSSEYASVANYTAWFQLFDEESEPSGGGWKNSVLANNPGGIPDFVGNRIRPIRAF